MPEKNEAADRLAAPRPEHPARFGWHLAPHCTTASRFLDMGYALAAEDEDIAKMILDMHLRGQSGRPSIEKVRGRLEWEYESRYDSSWQEDLYASSSGRQEDKVRKRPTRGLKRTPEGAA